MHSHELGIERKNTNGKNASSQDSRWFTEGLVTAISVGGFFILVGIIYATNQNLLQNLINFFNDFTNVQLQNSTISLLAPFTPAAHTAVYLAAFQFALGIGIIQIIVLAARLALGSRIRRTAQAVGGLIFWFGTAYMLNGLAEMKTALSHDQQLVLWFQFWAVIIMLIGISLLARAAVLLIASKRS